MALMTSDSARGGAPQRPVFGPAVWGWAPASGLALWVLGFFLLPWWAALLIWWWPSIIGGAAVGLATIGIVKLVARTTKRRHGLSPADGGEPPE